MTTISSTAAGHDRPRSASPTSHRRADIQGLRAVAVAMVVVFHATPLGIESQLPGGFTGVDVFFVISGFVIMGMLLSQLQGDGLRLSSFYARRVRRVLPALALLIAIVAVLSVVVLSPLGTQQAASRTGAAASVFGANIQLERLPLGYFDLNVNENPFLHLWSIAAEEQFYLVFPAFLLGAWALARKIRRRSQVSPVVVLFGCIGVGVAASFAISLATSTSDPTFAFYSSPTRAWEFGAGALLALVVPRLERLPAAVGVVMGVAGAALLVVAALRIESPDTGSPFPGTTALIPVAAAALLIAAGCATTAGVTALLSWRPAVWIGDRSYGWYLWHWPVIVFARALGTFPTLTLLIFAAASLIPTVLSYRFLENPIRFDAGIVGRRAVRIALVCIAVPLAASLALGVSAHFAFRTDAVQAIARQVLPEHADRGRGCRSLAPLRDHEAPQCTWRVKDPRGTIALVGDSNAAQFTEPVLHAARRAGFDLTVATKSSCPFVDIHFEDTTGSTSSCRHFIAAALAELISRRPALVVVASSTSAYVNDRNISFRETSNGEASSSVETRAQLYERGLETALRRLGSAGIPTLVVHVIPHPGNDRPRSCPAVRIYLNVSSCGTNASRAFSDGVRRLAYTAEQGAVVAVPSASSIDFTDDLCSREVCPAERDGLWLYRDETHLTVLAALTLTDRFEQVIRERARDAAAPRQTAEQ